MSYVTNVILSANVAEEAAINWINSQWMSGGPLVPLSASNAPVAGTMELEVTICVAACNGLDLAEFRKLVKSAPWSDPDSVRVFVANQEEDAFIAEPGKRTTDVLKAIAREARSIAESAVDPQEDQTLQIVDFIVAKFGISEEQLFDEVTYTAEPIRPSLGLPEEGGNDVG